MPALRFLIAEDHEFQRMSLARTLKTLGAETIHEAADGNDALKILQDPVRPVDIVISDLDMPGMDGMEFVRHLGQTGARVSIILASALDRKLLTSIETMSRAYGINLLGVLEKPLTPDKLVPLISLHRTAQVEPDRPAGAVFTLDEIVAGLRNDEFEPFFQPKIDLATGRVKGAEALARWRHSKLGIVSPYAFIKALEDNGLIDELTWIMLRKAAASCSTWRATGIDANVSVNLSVKSLGEVEIAERVTEIVRSQHLDPCHMILELTESAATTNLGNALENLARLRMKGFGLSIDDYGTGYSSMQQLARIAFTELKIDQSFVIEAARQNSARVILESSLEMAKKLSMVSVAEGVETRASFELLLALHCDMAQGYFIARPMDDRSYLAWIQDWKQHHWYRRNDPDAKNDPAPASALTKVLGQSTHVKEIVEECAVELCSVNSELKQASSIAKPLPGVERALERTESVGEKVQEASEKLAVVNLALGAEVRERHVLEHQLAELKENEEAARHAAFHDPLTGLPNRALFDDRLEHGLAQAKRHGRALAVMFVDLDDFKFVNDAHGHEAGDGVLQTIAWRLRENTRDDDTVSRRGGDEFTYLVMELGDEQDIRQIAQKLINVIQLPCPVGVRDVAVCARIQASIGIAIFPRDGTTAESLVKRADQAMYQAKRSKSGFCFAS